jgi:hypothetical protein
MRSSFTSSELLLPVIEREYRADLLLEKLDLLRERDYLRRL